MFTLLIKKKQADKFLDLYIQRKNKTYEPTGFYKVRYQDIMRDIRLVRYGGANELINVQYELIDNIPQD